MFAVSCQYWSRFGRISWSRFGNMATVFLPAGRRLYTGKIRVLLPSGAISWRNIPTGCADRKQALAKAVAAEGAVGAGLDRARAESLVESLLQITGSHGSIVRPSLLAIGNELFDGREENIADGTRRKYAAHWKAFREWAAGREAWAADRWTAKECRAYYSHLRGSLSVTTANNHLTTLSMVFLRAQEAGHVRGNPVALVERAGNDSVEKRSLTRGDTARILWAVRHILAWRCLTALGWHTGHRINDLLHLTKDSVKHAGKLWTISFAPGKKRGRGRTVVLPIPRYVAKMLKRLGNFKALHNADNRNGLVSGEFVAWMEAAGVDPLPVKRGKRTVHLKSFHSFRHAMASRLTAAGVSGELARLVTDHESARVQKTYVHAEVEALAGALKLARRK